MSRLDDLSRFTSAAVNEIDASIFSGDEFLNEEARQALRFYIARWAKALDEYEVIDNMECAE